MAVEESAGEGSAAYPGEELLADQTAWPRHRVLDGADRVLVVGDVHGCAAELADLLAAYHRPGDALVLAGDIVNKGPDSLGALRLARERGALGVLGNHELAVLVKRASGQPGWWLQMSDADLNYIKRLPYTLSMPGLGALVVHAGLDPARALESQRPRHMVTMRDLLPDGRGGWEPSARNQGHPWAARWDSVQAGAASPRHVLFGHDAQRKLQRYKYATGLDTGCLYGGRLSGAVLEKGQPIRLVSVPSRRQYVVPKGERPARWWWRAGLLGVAAVGIWVWHTRNARPGCTGGGGAPVMSNAADS